MERSYSLFYQLPALTEPYFSILKAWDPPVKCDFTVPSEPHGQGELSYLGQIFNWGHLSHPGGTLQMLLILDNPVCMNDEAEYVIQVYFWLKCLFPVNTYKKKLVLQSDNKNKIKHTVGLMHIS